MSSSFATGGRRRHDAAAADDEGLNFKINFLLFD